MIEAVLGVLFVFLMGAGYVGYARLNNRLARLSSGTPVAAAIEPPKRSSNAPRGHELKKIYFTNNTSSYRTDGWWFQCQCGTSATSIEKGHNKNSGSEEAAMNRWKKHAALYKDMDAEDPWETKYRELQAKHNDYLEKCICKELH